MTVQQAKQLYTQALVAVYTDQTAPLSFLRSFFKDSTSDTKLVSVEVQRGTEKVAIDVVRGTNGNRNSISRSTERIIEPPMYDEFLDATSLDAYDNYFGAGASTPTASTAARFLNSAGSKLALIRNKIERAYELQASQALFDGIVQLKNGDNIDYKRKAGSLVDLGAGSYWSAANAATADPLADFKNAGDFLRNVGKMRGGVLNVVLGGDAYAAMLQMDKFKETSDLRRIDLVDITGPVQNSVGGVLHGEVSAGNYKVRLWTYPEVYTDANGDQQDYVPQNKFLALPEMTNFNLAYAATPVVMDLPTNSAFNSAVRQKKGKYNMYDYVDKRKATHNMGLRSAGIAILTAVDQVYTAQVLA